MGGFFQPINAGTAGKGGMPILFSPVGVVSYGAHPIGGFAKPTDAPNRPHPASARAGLDLLSNSRRSQLDNARMADSMDFFDENDVPDLDERRRHIKDVGD